MDSLTCTGTFYGGKVRDEGVGIVRAIENQINMTILIQVKTVNSADGTITADIDILAGGVQLPVSKILESLLHPRLYLSRGGRRR